MDTRRCEVLSTASEPTPEVPTDPPHTPPLSVCGRRWLQASCIIIIDLSRYLYILTKLFFPFGFMIPCLQPDSASERASGQKKRKSCRLCFIPPRYLLGGSTSVLRAGYCTVPEKHDAGIMRIGNCFNAYCIYLASRSYVTFLLRVATRIEIARSSAWMWSRLVVYMGGLMSR